MPGHQSFRISASARHSLLKYPIRHIRSLITCLLASIFCSCCQSVAHRLKLLCPMLMKFLAGWSSPIFLCCHVRNKLKSAQRHCLANQNPCYSCPAIRLGRRVHNVCSEVCMKTALAHSARSTTTLFNVHILGRYIKDNDVLSSIQKLVTSPSCPKDDSKSMMWYSSALYLNIQSVARCPSCFRLRSP